MADDVPVAWQKEIGDFFEGIGLTETSKCFETELLVLSRHHQERIPQELEKLAERLIRSLEQHVTAKEHILMDPESNLSDHLIYKKRKRRSDPKEESEDDTEEEKERVKRLDPDQVQIRATNADIEQRINTYIQAKQNDVDASNRTEFLNRADPSGEDVTCARTDAREINRNIQMKFDIVNNEDGPLARSLVTQGNHVVSKPGTHGTDVDERLRNLEDHLNVKYERRSDPPFSLFERVKILENTFMEIERQNPSWAAVHFNQPGRTSPPPPPITYISRPSTGSPPSSVIPPIPQDANNTYTATQITTAPPPSTHPHLKTTGRANSSLTRAVIEQLNRQQQASVTRQTIGTLSTP